MKDAPAQFSVLALFGLTAAVAVIAALARVLPGDQVAMLLAPPVLALAPSLLGTAEK